MPHIVTTRPYATSSACPRPPAPRTRTAVAVLDEESAGRIANQVFDGTVDGMDFYEIRNDLLALPDEGGTVDLPNGTVIDVKPITLYGLAENAGWRGWKLTRITARPDLVDPAEVVAAWNEAHR